MHLPMNVGGRGRGWAGPVFDKTVDVESKIWVQYDRKLSC